MNILSVRPRRALALAAGIALASLLAACGDKPRPGVRPALTQPIGNAQQLEDVVSALKLGDTKRARKLLKTMAKRDPADRRVAVLREGLDGDPTELLGPVAFDYRVESGDQLTGLAQRYLGDRLKFYLLARYNRLTTDALVPGQVLRIPGAAPVVKVRTEARPEPKANTRADPRPAAAPTSPRQTAAVPATPVANPAAAGRLRAQGLRRSIGVPSPMASSLLRRALSLDPASAPIRSDLARAERLLHAVKARR